ncbi:MAG: two-component system regulatory protein YycI [Lawsonibacter sp.]|jgi:hypothetical protein
MEGRKLKNIALLILVVTNLCLLTFVLQRELQDQYYSWQARENAIQLLKERGVDLKEEQVPDQDGLLPQIVERDLEREGILASQILGDEVQTENRGAGVYRYFNVSGSLQFHSDGTFSGEFSPGMFPVGEQPAEDCLALLERIGFEGTLIEETEHAMVFQQSWDEIPIYNQQVTLEVNNECVTAMRSGRRLIGTPQEDTGRSTVTAATALIEAYNGINALGYVCSRIDSITPGYLSSTSLTGVMFLTPVWRIVTDTGSYQLDMVTGELTRMA